MLRFFHDSVDSTNDEARRLVAAGRVDDRACVVAREQTGGRGTRGRTWASPAGAGLYCTLIETFRGESIRPTPLFSLAAGVACAEAIADVTGVHIELKPVNDLYADGGKLGGILCEAAIAGGNVTSVLTGVGINLRVADRSVPADAPRPVFLEEFISPDLPRAINDTALLDALLTRLVTWLMIAREDDVAQVRTAWERWCRAGDQWPDEAAKA